MRTPRTGSLSVRVSAGTTPPRRARSRLRRTYASTCPLTSPLEGRPRTWFLRCRLRRKERQETSNTTWWRSARVPGLVTAGTLLVHLAVLLLDGDGAVGQLPGEEPQ